MSQIFTSDLHACTPEECCIGCAEMGGCGVETDGCPRDTDNTFHVKYGLEKSYSTLLTKLSTDVHITATTIEIHALSDFPTPDENGDIVLETKTYFIRGMINLGLNRLVIKDTATKLYGVRAALDGIISLNADCTIHCTGSADTVLTLLSIINTNNDTSCYCTESMGKTFITECFISENISLAAPNSTGFLMKLSSITGTLILEENSNYGNLQITEVFFGPIMDNGIGVDLKENSTVAILEIEDSIFQIMHPSGIGFRVFDEKQVSFGSMEGISYFGIGTLTNNFDKSSSHWNFHANHNIPDSSDRGISSVVLATNAKIEVDLPDNQLWTTISDGGVELTYTLDPSSEKFSLNDTLTGEMRYEGVRQRAYKINAAIAACDAGPTIDIEYGISLNGADPIPSTVVNSLLPGQLRTVTLPVTSIDLVSGDTIKIMARNIDTGSPTADVSINRVVLSVFY